MGNARSVLGLGLALSGLTMAGCGADALERVTMAEETTAKQSSGCGDADFTLRVVYNVVNTYEREELRDKGAPAQAKGVTQSELIIRDDATLVRRTGKTYIKDPQKFLDWERSREEVNNSKSNEEFMNKAAIWKYEGTQIPMKTVPIEWVEHKARPGQYSYRYGLNPMVPLAGEKWREDDRGWDADRINEALFDQQFATLDPRLTNGLDVSTSTFAGVECEMLRRRIGNRVHETCYATLDGRTVVLHGMDKTAAGMLSQTAVSLEQGLCVPDSMMAAPGRVDFEDVS
ncbi:MAG: hypothetical protein AB8G17_17120 [Gammaproteobacteria bacterium]